MLATVLMKIDAHRHAKTVLYTVKYMTRGPIERVDALSAPALFPAILSTSTSASWMLFDVEFEILDGDKLCPKRNPFLSPRS